MISLRKPTMSVVAAAACWAGIGVQTAGGVPITFPDSGSNWISHGNGTSGIGLPTDLMGQAGDFVSETFLGTGVAAVDGLVFSFPVRDLLAGSSVTLGVLINAVQVDTVVVPDCSFCSSTFPFSDTLGFSPIVGAGDYTLEILLLTSVPSGDGVISFPSPGSFALSAAPVPEPAGLGLAGLAAAGVGVLVRRRCQTLKAPA